MSQWTAYCNDSGLRLAIRKEEGIGVIGLGGLIQIVGRVIIQVPSLKLHLIMDIDFSIVYQNIPELLSLKDMLDNGIYISVENGCAYYGGHIQPSSLENFFLVHR